MSRLNLYFRGETWNVTLQQWETIERKSLRTLGEKLDVVGNYFKRQYFGGTAIRIPTYIYEIWPKEKIKETKSFTEEKIYFT